MTDELAPPQPPPDSCVTCRCFFVMAPDSRGNVKTLCRKRLHSGTLFTQMETTTKVHGMAMSKKPTGKMQHVIASYFPETRPEWWCDEYQFKGALVTIDGITKAVEVPN